VLMRNPKYGLNLNWQTLQPQWPIVRKILRLGFPAAIEQSMGALTVTVTTVLAAGFGTLALASYGIVFRIMTFVVIPAYGISMATSILLSQNLGAGEVTSAERIANTAAKLGFMLLGTAGACLFIAAKPIAGMFVPNEPELIAHCAVVLRIFVLGFPLAGIQMAMYGAFRGAGDTMSAMMLTLAGIWLIQIPLSIVLSQYTPLGEMGLWWTSLVASTINTLIAVLYFKSNRWKGKLTG
jgi:putative MATE family efflux protein